LGLLDLLHEVGSARLGYGAQVLHQLRAAHAHPLVGQSECLLLLVDFDADVEGLEVALTKDGGVCERHETQLAVGVGAVGDELAQEDLLVLLETVDDDVQHAVHVGVEVAGLSFRQQGLQLLISELVGVAWGGG